MDQIRQYFLSVISAAIVCGILNTLTKKGTSQTVVKLLTGIFLTLTVIRPLTQLELKDITDFLPAISQDAQAAAAEGEIFARDAAAGIIKAEAEAYILDKAKALNLDLSVEVILSEEDTPLPVSVRLSGNTSPYAKQQLRQLISQDLGIPEEEQQWTQ